MSRDDADHASLIEQAAIRLRQASLAGQPGPGMPHAQVASETESVSSGHVDPDRSSRVAGVHVDVARLKEEGYLTPDGERTRVAEEFRIIKRPLLENAFGKGSSLVEHGNLIMVTSALPGEGKTYTAINLAMSIAMEMDKTVLLVDADVGKARVHEMLRIPMGPGLIDLLIDDSLDAGDVMLQTDIPKLRVIPMGQYHPHSTELLASDEMRRLMEELATRYSDRVVIFDSPPLLATSEAVVLAGLMGQLVFVVESTRSLQGTVKDALSLVDASKPVGLVLNKVRKLTGTNHYGYGSYGYGHHRKD